MGCLEKHAQHLPLGTDYYIARDIVLDAVRQEAAVVFPLGFWLGDVAGSHSNRNPGKSRKHGYIGINIRTMLRTLEELCDEIARNGFDKILILSAHGGNVSMFKTLVRQLEQKEKPYKVFYSTVANNSVLQPEIFVKQITGDPEKFPMITETDIAVMKSWIPTGYQGGHANFLETADVMATRPHLVAQDRYYAEDGINNHRTDYLTKLGISIKGDWSCRYPNAYSGAAPHGCSQSIGQAVLKLNAEALAAAFKLLKTDEECMRIANGIPMGQK